MPTLPPTSPTVHRVVRFIERRRHSVLALAVVAVAVGAGLGLHLELRTDMSELLPSTDPAVVEFNRIKARLGALTTLEVAIQGPAREANLRYAEMLASRLRAEPPTLVAQVTYHVREERRFIEGHKWLYARLRDLEEARDRLQSEIRRRKNPLVVSLDDDEEGSLEALEERLKRRAAQVDRFPDGYFMSRDGTLVVMLVRPPGTVFAENAGEALLARVKELVAANPPRSYHPAMRVNYTGQVHDSVVERRALESDLVWATTLCVLLVAIAVTLFYGRLRALPLMAAPATVGVTLAFGLAYLRYGYLNASTAFLGSIIVGNGINFAIIQLARYEEERRAGVVLSVALQRSVAGTARATGIAALAASLAYGSLMVTQFRGFSQFGVIGGFGMIAAWVATVTVLPALLAVVDRRRAHKPLMQRGLWFGIPFARAATRAPGVLIGIGAILTVVAAVAIPAYLRDPFEYDFRKLRAQQEPEQRELSGRIDDIFGRAMTPSVILAESFEQTRQVARALRERDAGAQGGVIGQIAIIDDLLPGSQAEQEQKLRVLGQIRALMNDSAFELLDERERAQVRKWEPPADLTLITADDLPEAMVMPFRDAQGNLAPLVLVYQNLSVVSTWNGRDLMRIAAVIQEVPLEEGKVVRATGTAVVFAGMIRSIVKDGPIATAASFLGVLLLVLFLARGVRGGLIVVSSLVFGVLWMVGTAAVTGVRVNFLNFIALPITFGIGVDYAINVYLRYRLEGPGRMGHTVRATGGAVALCSATTIIGYGALLAADNQGLRSFGAMAIIGEFTCLFATLLLMPAWFVFRDRRWARQRARAATTHPSGMYPVGRRAARSSATATSVSGSIEGPQERSSTEDRRGDATTDGA